MLLALGMNSFDISDIRCGRCQVLEQRAAHVLDVDALEHAAHRHLVLADDGHGAWAAPVQLLGDEPLAASHRAPPRLLPTLPSVPAARAPSATISANK